MMNDQTNSSSKDKSTANVVSWIPQCPHSRGPGLFLACSVQSAENTSTPTFLRASPH
jgi:hypothetical protein